MGLSAPSSFDDEPAHSVMYSDTKIEEGKPPTFAASSRAHRNHSRQKLSVLGFPRRLILASASFSRLLSLCTMLLKCFIGSRLLGFVDNTSALGKDDSAIIGVISVAKHGEQVVSVANSSDGVLVGRG